MAVVLTVAMLTVAACAIMRSAATRLSRGAAATASKAKSARSPEAAACNQQESPSTELQSSQNRAHSTAEPQLTQGCSAYTSVYPLKHVGGRRLIELCGQQLDHIRREELGSRHRAARKQLGWAEEKQGVRVVRQREAVCEEQVEIVELAAVRDEGLLVSSQGSVVRCMWQ